MHPLSLVGDLALKYLTELPTEPRTSHPVPQTLSFLRGHLLRPTDAASWVVPRKGKTTCKGDLAACLADSLKDASRATKSRYSEQTLSTPPKSCFHAIATLIS